MKRASIVVLFILASGLAPIGARAASGCAVSEDPTGDTRSLGRARGAAGTPDGATDLVSLSITSTPQAIAFSVGVRAITSRATNTDGILSVTWALREHEFAAFAERATDDTWRFGLARKGESRTRSVAGTVDEREGVARIFVPRAILGDPVDGETLRDMWVAARETGVPVLNPFVWASITTTRSDDAAVEDYVVGSTCDEGIGAGDAGPLAVDDSGDATPRPSGEHNQEAVSEDALDITTLGFSSTVDELVPAVRVVNPKADLPPGMNLIGWTTSWCYGGSRWAVQASIGPQGTRFSYAQLDDSAELSSPIFNATPTTGSIGDDGVITVAIPRWVVGDPEDGASFTALGTLSWAARSGNPTAYHTFDTTPMTTYAVGTLASA